MVPMGVSFDPQPVFFLLSFGLTSNRALQSLSEPSRVFEGTSAELSSDFFCSSFFLSAPVVYRNDEKPRLSFIRKSSDF